MCSTKDIISSTQPIPDSPRICADARWPIFGAGSGEYEGRARGRMRGLEERLKDVVGDDRGARALLDEAKATAGALAGEGAVTRIVNAAARNPGEAFLAAVISKVRGTQRGQRSPLLSRGGDAAAR